MRPLWNDAESMSAHRKPSLIAEGTNPLTDLSAEVDNEPKIENLAGCSLIDADSWDDMFDVIEMFE